MAFERRSFAGGGANTTLASGIDGSTDTISITDATGWPSGSGGDFFVVIDIGQSTEEKVRVASRAGTTLTVATSGRGADGTSGVAHDSGATIALCLAAVDLDEANEHVSDSRTTAHAAGKISYDNATSELTADTVQDAIDEVVANAAGGVGLIACKTYGAGLGSATSVNATASSADIDATNLAVSFVVPASGAVLVRLTGYAYVTAATSIRYQWVLREGSSEVGTATTVMGPGTDPYDMFPASSSVAIVVTGLTPGASKSYKWGHWSSTSGAGAISYGLMTTGAYATAVMEVWAAPA